MGLTSIPFRWSNISVGLSHYRGIAMNDEKREKIKFTRLVHQTKRAYLLDVDGEEIWLPKSQVDIDGPSMTLFIPKWLMDEKELG